MKIIKLVLCLSIVSCFVSCKLNIPHNNNVSIDDFADIISNIDTNSYNEIDWMTGNPSDGIIVYNGYKLCDIDNDGIDELFVLRQYVNNKANYNRNIKDVSDLGEFYKYAIRQNFISESYKIIDGKAEHLYLDGELLMTQAFEGGHFGIYYFLLENGNIAKFYNSYWEENLAIYDKLKFETLISYIGDMNTGEWNWEIDKKKVNKSDAINIIKNINIHGR